MVKETPSKTTADSDEAEDGLPSRRPVRKSAARAHLAWESEKSKRNKSEPGPKSKLESGLRKPAVNAGRKVTKPNATYSTATIPNTSDEEEVPEITKIGPPKKAKPKIKTSHNESEPEDIDKGKNVAASSNAQRRGQHRRMAAESPRTSSRRARDDDNNVEELGGFEEADSGKEVSDGYNTPGVDEEEEAEESEPEDNLVKLANNPRALLEKLDAEAAKWAEDDAEDSLAIEGLMPDDPPQTQSRRRRRSSSSRPTSSLRPASSRDRQREGEGTLDASSSSSRKCQTEESSDGEDGSSMRNPHPSKKTKPASTSAHNTTVNIKGKAKEMASPGSNDRQKQEEREQQRRERREQQKREERRKEREHQLRELERVRRHLEQEEDEDQVHAQRQLPSAKKQGRMEKGKEKGQGQGQDQEEKGLAKHASKSASATDKTNGNVRKKRSKANEDIVWVNERENEPSSSRHAPKRRRNDNANGEGSELSEVDADSELDCTEDNITAVVRKEGHIRLTDQHGRVQRVCTAAIKELLTNICIKNAFPDGPETSSNFAKSALITAAKNLKYEDIRKKLRADDDYGCKLASIPSQRVSNLRGRAKKAADPLVSTVFNLEDGDVDKVRWLHDGLRYIYPHNYENNTVDGDKAYSQPIFYQVLRNAFFNKPRSFGFKIADRFQSSHPEKPDEKEIPSALLALAATAVFASIEDHRTSRSEVGNFKSNLFLDAYRSNMDVLSEVKSDNIGAYHRLMHDLYCKLMGTSATSVRKNARSFLNAKGMAQ